MQYDYIASIERAKLISDWAKYTIERLQKNIDKRKIGVTGNLRNSFIYALRSAAEGNVSAILIEFNYYGKFVDMGVGAGQKIESVKSNRDAYALAGKRKGRHPKKWLGKTLYAEINELQFLLATKYKEQAANIIKESISQTINLTN